jgi:hypothetical protein
MPLIKKTKVATDMISLRVPLTVKAEFNVLRKLAEKHDIDFGASIAGTFAHGLADLRAEMEGLDHKGSSNGHHASNGKPDA